MNIATHLLARAVGFKSSIGDWDDVPPSFISDVLAKDVSYY